MTHEDERSMARNKERARLTNRTFRYLKEDARGYRRSPNEYYQSQSFKEFRGLVRQHKERGVSLDYFWRTLSAADFLCDVQVVSWAFEDDQEEVRVAAVLTYLSPEFNGELLEIYRRQGYLTLSDVIKVNSEYPELSTAKRNTSSTIRSKRTAYLERDQRFARKRHSHVGSRAE